MTYPRERNGWIDSGEGLHSNRGKTLHCPNCNSTSYTETISREHCSKCNYTVDYWGSGTNDVAESYFKRKAYREEMAEIERRRQEEDEQLNWWRRNNSYDE